MFSLPYGLKKWIGGAVILLLLIGLACFVISWRMECVVSSAHVSLSAPAISLMDELKLASAQKDKIESMEKIYRDGLVDLCRQHCETKMKLAKLLEPFPPDEKAVFAAVTDLGRVQMECERLTMNHIIAVEQVLDSNQRELFARRLSDQIIKTCPTVFAEPMK